MYSFDVVSQVDMQEVDNAINTVMRELINRYDFKSVKWSIELNKKDKQIEISAEGNYYLEQVQNSLKSAFIKRKLDPISLHFNDPEKAGGGTLRQIINIKQGIDQENAKKITKYFKQSKLKVQASIYGDEVRISGRSKDDLQAAIQEVKNMQLDLALQFINFRG